jgi:hypothetical protein
VTAALLTALPVAETASVAAPSTETPHEGMPQEMAEGPARHADRSTAHEPTREARERALHEARDAAKDAMGDARALKAWALAAYKAGALREARRAADTWILVESTPEPHILLAEIMDAMGHRGEARAVLAEVLESHPDSIQARRLATRYATPSSAPETSAQKSQVARR